MDNCPIPQDNNNDRTILIFTVKTTVVLTKVG